MAANNTFTLPYNLSEIRLVSLNFSLSYVNVQQENVFTLPYNLEIIPTLYQTNLDNSRFISNFPKWSTTYKNHFSNSAKLLSPMFSQFGGMLGNIAEYMVNNVKEFEFGYQQNYYFYIVGPNFVIPQTIQTEYGLLSYIGEYGVTFLGSYPITSVELIPVTTPIFQDVITTTPTVLSQGSNLYVQCVDACVENPVYFSLYGIDVNGTTVCEQIQMLTSDSYVTMNEYKALTRTIANDTVNINSYLDCVDYTSYTTTFGPQKTVTNLAGDYQQVVFSLSGQYLNMFNGNNLGHAQLTTYYLNSAPSHFFVSGLLDVIYLSGTNLCSTKLYNDVTKLQYNSTYNNNDFIYLDIDQPIAGSTINIGIKVQNIIQTYGTTNITLNFISNGVTTNIDLSGATTTSTQWISLTSNNIQYIPFVVPAVQDGQFVLSIYGSNQQYCAGYIFNVLPEYILATNISNMFFKNNNLYVVQDSVTYSISPLRQFFQSSILNGTNVLIFPQNFTELNFNV